ncbi:MAG: hypothetical protein J3R72DRAFT_498771 [Linnemannia gamsii]|nr:MAG: hypothetical protein J3R72DRAFT_498771 [Linnemannia gamsii]
MMVDRFVVLPNKTPDAIREIVLLGPVLDKEHYRALLNRFLNELNSEIVLNTNLLQGLVELVEHAPPFYLRADDLTKILGTIRDQLKDSALQDIEYTIHLTVAISKVLGIMVDCGVEYSYRALQLVPDDETLRQGLARNTIGLAGGIMKVAGAIKLDFGSVPEGLPVLIKSGRGLVNNLKKYFGTGDKNPWFLAVREAEAIVMEGRLIDLNRLILLSKLLKEVCNTPELELVLDRLKHQRRGAYSRHSVYNPPMSKPRLQAMDVNPDLLHEHVHQFLQGNGLVMLILGDSGAGKSTFNARLEQDLWNTYNIGSPIPLFIDLKAVRHLDQDLIRQHLDSLNMFSTSHLDDLRSREFILIYDGYDESQSRSNLHTNNQFNTPHQWRAKIVISCRTQYLTPGYRTYFAPRQDSVANLCFPAIELFTEAVIVPFKLDQIKEYIARYTAMPSPSGNDPKWTARQYMERLEEITHIMDLIKNPFMLRMVLEILPKITTVADKTEQIFVRHCITTTPITRVELYDKFMDLHYEKEQRRLIEQRSRGKMDADRLAIFQEIEGSNFTDLGIDFSKRLADAILKEEKGVNSVEYWSVTDKRTWKRQFFGSETMSRLLMESSQLIRRTSTPDPQDQNGSKIRSGGGIDTFKFSHLSILEYLHSLSIYDPREGLPELSSTGSLTSSTAPSLIMDHPLGRRSLVAETAVLQFLADRVRHAIEFKDHLDALIQLSKIDTYASCAAANAITILIRAGVRFNGADLRGIRIPGADLSGGDFDSAQIQGADLNNTVIRNTWLRQSDMSDSHMEGVMFGQYAYLEMEDQVWHCTFSHDGKQLAVGLGNGAINLYNTSTWDRVTSQGPSDSVTIEAHSSRRQHITSSDDNRTNKTVSLKDLSYNHVCHSGRRVHKD